MFSNTDEDLDSSEELENSGVDVSSQESNAVIQTPIAATTSNDSKPIKLHTFAG